MINDGDPAVSNVEITKQKRKTRRGTARIFTELEEFADDVRALLIFLGEAIRWVKGLAVTDKELFKTVTDMNNGDFRWITMKALPGKMIIFCEHLLKIFWRVLEALPPADGEQSVYDTLNVSNWVDLSAFKHINAVRQHADNSWNNGYTFGGLR